MAKLNQRLPNFIKLVQTWEKVVVMNENLNSETTLKRMIRNISNFSFTGGILGCLAIFGLGICLCRRRYMAVSQTVV